MAASRRRSTVVTVGVIALTTATLTACSTGSDYSGVCVDKKTNTRLKDAECRDDTTGGSAGGHGWYYYPAGSKAPAVGQPVSGGTYSVPSGKSASKGGLSAKGGTVSRGGFGSGHGSVGG